MNFRLTRAQEQKIDLEESKALSTAAAIVSGAVALVGIAGSIVTGFGFAAGPQLAYAVLGMVFIPISSFASYLAVKFGKRIKIVERAIKNGAQVVPFKDKDFIKSLGNTAEVVNNKKVKKSRTQNKSLEK